MKQPCLIRRNNANIFEFKKIQQNKMERKGINIKVEILEKNYREF